jgi:pilus assembly protein CpaC
VTTRIIIRSLRSRHASLLAVAILFIVALPLGRLEVVVAQGTAQAVQAPPPQPAPGPAIEKLVITAGRSTVLTTDFDIVRLAITNPAVADGTVVQAREILIDGKAGGTVSMIVWGPGRRVQYDVVVEPPVTTLEQRLRALFPGEDLNITVNEDALVLSGQVSSTNVMLRAAEIAQASATKSKIVNMLQVPGGNESQQVMLQVRFAEVNRHALEELGVSLFTTPTGFHDNVGRVTTGQFAGPGYTDLTKTAVAGQTTSVSGKMVFSDFLNLFVMNWKYDVGALIRALQTKGNYQSLAEPNLIAYNGRTANFLAGGEFPVPVVQGLAGSVTIEWKEFGVRLEFTPTIAGDVIRLHVKPEVSSLDFNNGITMQGFRIPAITSRRADTEVELRDGQSFAIAGLLNNISQEDRSAVPFLSSLPILGNLFKSKAYRAEKTELMVLITPQLVRALNPDEVPTLPTDPKQFLPRIGGKPGEPGVPLQGGSGITDAPPPKPSADKPKKKPGHE